MKFRSNVIAALLFIPLVATSCRKIVADGQVISETRQLEQFENVDVNGSEAVAIVPSNENKVTLLGSGNLISVYNTEVRNGTLHLSLKDGVLNVKKNDVVVTVFVKKFSKVRLNGSGHIEVGSFTSMMSLNASVNGSGSVKIKHNSFNTLEVYQNGSGNIEADNVVADSVLAKVSGSGNIRVYAVKFLDAMVAGSGEIAYKGSPVIRSNVSGSGGIRKLN